jgi:hypothetical protein
MDLLFKKLYLVRSFLSNNRRPRGLQFNMRKEAKKWKPSRIGDNGQCFLRK